MGFISESGDTLIPFGPYKFLNPIDEEGMILAHANSGKSGYINIEGDTLVSFIYQDVGLFTNGVAPARKNELWGFVDRTGKEVIPFKYETESYFRNCNLAGLRKNGRFGFINKEDEIIIPFQYDASRASSIDSLVALKEKGKWAFFGCNGNQLTPFQYTKIIEASYDEERNTFFFNGPCLVEVESGLGYINDQFEFLHSPGTFHEYHPFDPSKTAIVKSDLGYHIINTNGEKITSIDYDKARYFPYPRGRYLVEKNELKGLIDQTGKEILGIKYKEITPNYVKADTATTKILILRDSSNQASIMDHEGNYTVREAYDHISKFMHLDTISYSIVRKGDRYGLINSHGEIVLPIKYESIREYNKWGEFLIARIAGKEALLTKSGDTIFPFKYESIDPCFYDQNNRFIVEQNGHFGVIDLSQETIIPIEFDHISNWVEYGPKAHFVIKKRKHGLIGREGDVIVPPLYDEIVVDNTDIIKVKQRGLYGTVNWNHEVIHKIEYDQVEWEWPNLSGPVDTIYLKKDNRYYSTDLEGNVLEPSVPKSQFLDKFGYVMD